MKQYTKTSLNKVSRGANRAVYDKDQINSILDAGFIGFVTYNFEGTPISIPMAYGRIDDTIYLHGSKKNRMLLALLAQETASVTVMHLDGLVLARSGFHHSVNYRSATVFGTVTAVEASKTKETALKCIVDHMIPNRWDLLRPMSTKEFNATLVVALKITTASAKVRAEDVIDEKKDMALPIWAGIVPITQVVAPPVSDSHLDSKIQVPEHVLKYCGL